MAAASPATSAGKPTTSTTTATTQPQDLEVKNDQGNAIPTIDSTSTVVVDDEQVTAMQGETAETATLDVSAYRTVRIVLRKLPDSDCSTTDVSVIGGATGHDIALQSVTDVLSVANDWTAIIDLPGTALRARFDSDYGGQRIPGTCYIDVVVYGRAN